MPTWFPVAGTAVQRVLSSGLPASGYVLKLYTPGTTTNIPIATDSTGNTQANYAVANATGDWTVSGNTIIPHINTDYKLCIYATQAAADADTGAVISIDNIALATVFVTPATIGFTNTASAIDAAVDAVETIKTSKGALLTSTGATWAALAAGTNTHVLTADSAQTNGIKWASLAGLTVTLTTETFNASDTKTLPASTAYILYTVVGGGAGGGGGNASPRAGGGGAGGQVKTGILVPAGNLTITVGAGGNGGAAGAAGTDGSNSVLTDGTTTITAYGGGQANGNNNGVGLSDSGSAQCSGGGGGAGGNGGAAVSAYAGSDPIMTNYAANAGTFGGWAGSDTNGGGAGGIGIFCPISNSRYGGGGGGGGASAGSGRDGGANGGASGAGSAASANTGGGGGGGHDNNAGGNGGSGTVILTYVQVTA